jgi:hypothetical protein
MYGTWTTTVSKARQAWSLPLHFDWRYAVAGKRDLRLDFLRGFAVFAMIVDHLGGSSWLYPLTGGNHFFVSAAEGFVFISGLLVGSIYGDSARREGLKAATIKALKRAWTLYTLTVPLTLLFMWIVYTANLPFASWYALGDPVQTAINVLLLRRTFSFVDIPLLYTLLLLTAPIALALLARRHTGILLTFSFGLWGAYQLAPDQFKAVPWPIENEWIFNFAAWQLMFVVAMVIGYHHKCVTQWLNALPRYPALAMLALALLGLIVLYQHSAQLPADLLTRLFDKSSLAPGRLLASAIVFPFAYLMLTLFWRPLDAAFSWLLRPLGENSLYSYTMHVFWLSGFYLLAPLLSVNASNEMTVNTTLQLLAIALTWLMIRKQFLFRWVPR